MTKGRKFAVVLVAAALLSIPSVLFAGEGKSRVITPPEAAKEGIVLPGRLPTGSARVDVDTVDGKEPPVEGRAAVNKVDESNPGLDLSYVPKGFARQGRFVQGDITSVVYAGPSGAFVTLQYRDSTGHRTAVVDVDWRETLVAPNGAEVTMFQAKGSDMIHAQWSIQAEPTWRHFDVIARGLARGELRKVLTSVQ